MTFRERLLATIRAARPVLESPGALVALGLLSLMNSDGLNEFVAQVRCLRPELRHAVQSNLTILSLLDPRAGMPDPTHQRRDVSALLGRLERDMGAGS